ncbi:hypothetical protein MRX96_023903 [Rhipicephalus microplus]
MTNAVVIAEDGMQPGLNLWDASTTLAASRVVPRAGGCSGFRVPLLTVTGPLVKHDVWSRMPPRGLERLLGSARKCPYNHTLYSCLSKPTQHDQRCSERERR